MACGNNHITRDYLSSSPVSTASRTMAFLNSPPTAIESSRKELGDRGEALVARLLVEAEEHSLVYQHTPGDPSQGLDIVTLTPDGRLLVTEVKSTAAKRYQGPHTSKNVRDHQLDVEWTSKNLAAIGLEVAPKAIGEAFDQVSRQIAQFDAVSGTVTLWGVDSDGHRTGSTPEEIWDVQQFEGDMHE